MFLLAALVAVAMMVPVFVTNKIEGCDGSGRSAAPSAFQP
jgi:hypothetical protein